ncbi:MAG: glycosyltransferase family 39 protein [Bacteroidia bacterium]|nr:glycosyltransferase family 39 protein [Bacteroidia bacterium]
MMGLITAGLLFGSFISFVEIKSYLDNLSYDGNVESFTPVMWQEIQFKTRWVSIGFILAAIAFFLFRKNVIIWNEWLINELKLCYAVNRQNLLAFFRKENVFHVCLLMGIILSGVYIRLYYLASPIKYDEAFTYLYYASQPLLTIISNYSYPNNHIFHTILAHFSTSIFGGDEWAIRLPAFFGGILIIPLIYIFIRRIGNKNAALLAATLCAYSFYLVEFSVKARGYTIITSFFLIQLILADLLNKRSDRFIWLIFCIVSALGFWVIPVMIFPFGVVCLWVLFSIVFSKNQKSKRTSLKSLVGSIVIVILLTILLYMPVIIVSGVAPLIDNAYVVSSSTTTMFINKISETSVNIWEVWNKGFSQIIQWLMLIGFGVTLYIKKELRIFLFAIILSSSLLILLKFVMPPSRVWLFLLPIYFGLCSIGIEGILSRLSRKFKTIVVVSISTICLLIIVIGLTNIDEHKYVHKGFDGIEETSLYLKEKVNERDNILSVISTDIPLLYYFQKHDISLANFKRPISESERLFLIVNKTSKRTLDYIVKKYKISKSQFSSPTLINEFDDLEVYEMTRID